MVKEMTPNEEITSLNRRARRATKQDIVKVSKPAHENGLWSVYGKGGARAKTVSKRDVPGYVQQAMAVVHIAYFYARWDEQRGLWIMGERAPDQEWI